MPSERFTILGAFFFLKEGRSRKFPPIIESEQPCQGPLALLYAEIRYWLGAVLRSDLEGTMASNSIWMQKKDDES